MEQKNKQRMAKVGAANEVQNIYGGVLFRKVLAYLTRTFGNFFMFHSFSKTTVYVKRLSKKSLDGKSEIFF